MKGWVSNQLQIVIGTNMVKCTKTLCLNEVLVQLYHNYITKGPTIFKLQAEIAVLSHATIWADCKVQAKWIVRRFRSCKGPFGWRTFS
jgi:hypothetical protein